MKQKMTWLFGAMPSDPSDPTSRGYRRFLKKVRNLVLALTAMLIVVVWWGVPSIQGDYRYSRRVTGIPGATDKLDADYWNPLVGWQTVRSGELAEGCPIIVFLPLRRCMNLHPYKNAVTTRLFGKEFFDGP